MCWRLEGCFDVCMSVGEAMERGEGREGEGVCGVALALNLT